MSNPILDEIPEAVCADMAEMNDLSLGSMLAQTRKDCAEIARQYARELSKGIHPRAGSVEEIGERIAQAILNQQ